MTAKILLVDDEPGVRLAVKEYLEDSEFTVEVAANAKEAWQILQKNNFDLVISDIMMPQVSGYEFLQQLRADNRFEAIPVIFLTARGMKSDRIQGYKTGCDAYLSKPFDPDELIAIVQNILQRKTISSNQNSDTDLGYIVEQLEKIKGMITNKGGSSIVITPSPINIELTPREQSVLNLVSKGLMNKEIAKELETSVRNVEKYVSRLFSKTGTNSRTELVRFALEHGLTN
jgi:DNA-binding NarL/FixJ family response regulator